jgi:pimeloyl-ACP methyl ester carboxylesterase
LKEEVIMKSIYKSEKSKKLIMDYYDRIIKNYPVEYSIKEVDTSFGKTNIIASGLESNSPLILLHGSSSNALSWIGDVKILSEKNRVYAIDIPGEPGKSTENRPRWDNDDFSVWLCDVYKALNLESANIAGISYGGWISLRFAVMHPEKIDKLVLFAPGGIVQPSPGFLFRAMLYTMYGKRGAIKLNEYLFGKDNLDPFALEYMTVIMTGFKSRMGKQTLLKAHELENINLPVKLVLGLHDRIFNAKKTKEIIEKYIKNIDITVFEEKGHALVNNGNIINEFIKKSFAVIFKSNA